MAIMEREVQKIKADCWEELEKLNKQYAAVEAGLGFPPFKRYKVISGGQPCDTLILERVWDSLSAMEEAKAKLNHSMLPPGVHDGITEVVLNVYREFLEEL